MEARRNTMTPSKVADLTIDEFRDLVAGTCHTNVVRNAERPR